MSNGGEKRATDLLFGEVERDFEALVRVIERAIEHIAANDAEDSAIEGLTRAREAAQRGATLAREARQRRLKP